MISLAGLVARPPTKHTALMSAFHDYRQSMLLVLRPPYFAAAKSLLAVVDVRNMTDVGNGMDWIGCLTVGHLCSPPRPFRSLDKMYDHRDLHTFFYFSLLMSITIVSHRLGRKQRGVNTILRSIFFS
jgi:hypothetical protein